MQDNKQPNSSSLTDLFQEPLAQLSMFSWMRAPGLCCPEHGCADYHRVWSLIRLLLNGGAQPSGGAFFKHRLASLCERKQPRILVSGGADTGLTSLVIQVCQSLGLQPTLVFVDQCATPCAQHEWMSRRSPFPLEIHQADIRTVEMPAVDAIIAHTFLTFFAWHERQRVLDAWARLSRPGALLLMSNAMMQNEAEWNNEKDPVALAQAMEQLAELVADDWPDPMERQDLMDTAHRFWRAAPGQPPGLTPHNLSMGLQKAGFDLQEVVWRDVDAKGPLGRVRKHQGSRRRAEILALKR